MQLLDTRAAIIFGLAAGAAALTAALVLKEGKSWPTAILAGAGAFVGTATFMNAVIA